MWLLHSENYCQPWLSPSIAAACSEHRASTGEARVNSSFRSVRTPLYYPPADDALGMEALPKGFWARNLYYLLTPEHFKKLERFVVQRAGNCCELCGAREGGAGGAAAGGAEGGARAGKLAAVGRWEVNERACRIRLRRVVACCPDCARALNPVRGNNPISAPASLLSQPLSLASLLQLIHQTHAPSL